MKKRERTRNNKPRRRVVVAVSGGFDPIHVGHVRLFHEAKKLGDELVVILNNDHWLRKKKNSVFMSQNQRRELIEAFSDVDRVVITGHGPNPTDMTVTRELMAVRPDIFANGGDRTPENARDTSSSLNPEQRLCSTLGIEMVFNVGHGGKVQSSSWLLAEYLERATGARSSAPGRGRARRASSKRNRLS